MNQIDRGAVDLKRVNIDELMATATKHWVRVNAWLPVAKCRANTLGGYIRYFTLTTGDLFDVKMLVREGLLERTSRGYPGLGFCEMSEKTYDEILRKIRWSGWHYKGMFEDMVGSLPNFEEEFEFDVVNLDFTGVPFPDHEAPLEGTWGAIEKTLDAQWKHGKSFDLFLTFRGKREETDGDALQLIADLVQLNLGRGRGRQEFETRIGHTNAQKLLSENYAEFLCVGIPKLLINHALQAGYSLTYFEVFCYLREGEHGRYHIVKLIFSFEVPQLYSARFAQSPPIVSSYDEAVPMIFNKETLKVDDVLENNRVLIDNLEKDMRVLGNFSIYV